MKRFAPAILAVLVGSMSVLAVSQNANASPYHYRYHHDRERHHWRHRHERQERYRRWREERRERYHHHHDWR